MALPVLLVDIIEPERDSADDEATDSERDGVMLVARGSWGSSEPATGLTVPSIEASEGRALAR